MEQKHTEQTVEHSDGQQDTGNHKKPGAPDQGGADRFGGTGQRGEEGGEARAGVTAVQVRRRTGKQVKKRSG